MQCAMWLVPKTICLRLWWIRFVVVLFLFSLTPGNVCYAAVPSMEFEINSLWNGEPLAHAPMKVRVEPLSNGTVKVTASGILFNDPPSPPPFISDADQATDKLWEYEVVELFFLNSADGTYVEVELGPHGHHLVLLLNGRRNSIKTLLPLKYSITSKTDASWTGEAFIPIEYFPPKVDKFNAFAIHGSGDNIHYEQLYPQRGEVTVPDFHRLQDFSQIDFEAIIDGNQNQTYSVIWRESMTPTDSPVPEHKTTTNAAATDVYVNNLHVRLLYITAALYYIKSVLNW